ncbi:MAG TPA: hypothetical protein VMX16_14580 [Terriglobia bacterium]|nr:hypothetical protein [Terriglobia bacterium]
MASLSTLRKRKPKATALGSARVERRLRPQNKKLLQWLDSWLAAPDDRGERWWEDFEADLQGDRVTFPGTLSTAAHCDQSSDAIRLS